MRRFYSHYAFIYPDIYLKDCIVELDLSKNNITYYPFIHEVANTEFYSGWLFFVPSIVVFQEKDITRLKEFGDFDENKIGSVLIKGLYYCYNDNIDIV